MNTFVKFVNGNPCQATPLYSGQYNQDVFLMPFKEKYWFDLEVKGLERLDHKSYAPKVLNIDRDKMIITLDWQGCVNLNHAFHQQAVLPSDWQSQIKTIIRDLESDNFYRLNIYPHTFYIKNYKIHIMDLYACLRLDDLVSEEHVSKIINNKDRFLFKDGYLDILYTYNYTIQHNIGDWPGDFLND